MSTFPQWISLRRSSTIFATVMVCFLSAGAVRAETITIGLPVFQEGANSFPFGCGLCLGITRFQQVYSNAAFPDATPKKIIEIDFFRSTAYSQSLGGNLGSGTFILSLSTTSKSVGALDTTNFDTNLGPDNVVVANTILDGGPAPTVLTFPLSTPFVYDPAAGNLLLDIQMSNLSSTGPSAYFDIPVTSGGRMSRAYNCELGVTCVVRQDESSALVTGFIVVPEPSSILVLASGLAGIFWTRHLRRRQRGSQASFLTD